MPEVSAIVVNHDGGTDILRCLNALKNINPIFQELIVIDNGSHDTSPHLIRAQFPDVEMIELPENLGPAIARNLGLKRAKSPLVLFVDDDVFLAPNSLELLMHCLEHKNAAVVVPRLVLLPENVIQADGADIHFTGTMTLRHGRARIENVSSEPDCIGTFSSSCLLADRACLYSVGGFDESFFIYQEDMELGLRLRSFGEHLYCESRAVAYHERGTGTPDLSFRDNGIYPRQRGYLTMRNRLRMVLLHYRLRTLLLLSPALVLYELSSVVFAIRKGWFTAWLQAWWWQIRQCSSVIRRRRWIQRQRCIEDVDLLVGGSLPLAPGVLESIIQVRLVAGLSWLFDIYWRVCRHLMRPSANNAMAQGTHRPTPQNDIHDS